MRTIIIGAGKVGFSIAQMLSQEEHDVVVIDRMGDRLDTVAEHLDVQVVSGNGASLSVLKEAGAENAELLAAVTEIDELNIVSCIVARSLGVKRTIARVRNPEYVDLDRMTHKEALGIDLIINPERVTAMAIARLAANAEAENAEFFAEGKIQLLELEIKPEMKAAGTILQDLKCPYSFLIVAILRGGRVVIPRGKDKLKLGDKIYILAQTHEMREVEKIFGQRHQEVANVAILGGGRGGFYLAQQLENDHVHVKIIEKDITRCRFLAEQLNHSLVIHGDGADLQLLEDENIGATDLFVALTGDDKLNLLVSLLAKHLGAKKTIAQIRRSDYNPLVEKVGIDRVVSPRKLTAGAILGFVRKGKVISVTLLDDTEAEITEFIVPDSYRHRGKALKEINFPTGAIIGALVRDKKVIVPGGHDIILPGDQVVVFTLPNYSQKIEKFFS
ncbi:MAG: Trk system potassium transporter TrkA [Dehalobacterium sp.]